MRLASLLLLAVLLAGCGTKGPLYYRDNPPAGVKPPRPEPYKPVPYPKDADEDTGADPAKK
jgi:predicted small lipoprotein YifL